jgi:hypothetical protein
MIRHLSMAAAVACLSASFLRADFSYEQTTKVTGGMMAGFMKFAGAFSKQARGPMKMTVAVAGDRMATTSDDLIHVIDLSKETMTTINLKDRTYSVMTFADMKRAMEKMSEKLNQQKDASVDFKVDVKSTGATRQISGLDTRETILTITAEGTDAKSGAKGGTSITTNMWLASNLPGYDEVKNFHSRMAQKIAWNPGSGFLSAVTAQQPGASKGFAEMYKEASKLEGIPVLQVTRIAGAGQGAPTEADLAAAQQSQQQEQTPPPSVSEAAGSAAAGAAASRMGKIGGIAGGLGGFGGFGRKKKKQPEEEAKAAEPAPAPAPQASAAGPTPPGTLIELTAEMSSFSSALVDTTKFDVPSGFKQVENPMQKALR